MASLSATSPANLMLGFPPRALIPTISAIKPCTRAFPASSRLRLALQGLGMRGEQQIISLVFKIKIPLFDGTARLQINLRRLMVSATNSGSANEKTPNREPDVNEPSNAAEGPPLPTILAGAFVFFIVCWFIGSIIMWLISLIVNVPSPK